MHRLLNKSKSLFSFALDQQSMRARRSYFYKSGSSSYPEDTIKYAFNLKLHPGKSYQGLANIKFTLQQLQSQSSSSPLFLDFQGKSIKQIELNSQKLDPSINWQKGRIQLSHEHLKKGENTLYVNYENSYDSDGSGCVSFIDVDEKQYLYTQFQPYMANRVFPIFDQPDLKAKMKLSIACPSQWKQVLSNEFQDQTPRNVCQTSQKVLHQYLKTIPSNYKQINFKETKLLPSYLYCFVVGPYKKLVCSNTYKNIPMNLYCIESLYPYLQKQAPFIQQMTNLSMKFFEKYFGHPYPFNKYDQVFAHEYKWGAMENAGIVTLNDLYIFKDPVSIQRMLGFGNTIVHELAHHWFGNLVTMKWWDDLWLNESFAEYISHFCLEKIKGEVTTLNYQSAMASFLSRKNWGYAEDQLITTHPIRSKVDNTEVAQSIFDGITYSKGAATMKQLMYLMGEQNFSKALSEYFHKFAFKNAELDDLLRSLSNHYPKSSISMDEWKQMWLQKQGLNALSHRISEDGHKLIIKQENYHKNHETLRSHRLKLALFDSPTDFIQIQILVEPKKQTVIHLSQKFSQKIQKSKAILINHQDLTFAKVVLDDHSIQFFKENLKNIDNVLTKSLVWKIFYDMVKDAKLKISDYISTIENNLFEEISDNLLQENLAYALVAIQKYVPYRERAASLSTLFNRIIQQFKQNGENLCKNRQVILRDKLIAFTNTESPQDIKLLHNWLTGSSSSEQSTIFKGQPNITQSWKILIKILSENLNILQETAKQNLLEKMCERDQSDTMKNKKITCQAILMNPEQLSVLFQRYVSDQNWTMVSFQHSLMGFNSSKHKDLIRKTYLPKYYQILGQTLSRNFPLEKSVLHNNQMLQIFIQTCDPIIEDTPSDLTTKLQGLQSVQVKQRDKIRILLNKKMDLLQKRKICYQIYN